MGDNSENRFEHNTLQKFGRWVEVNVICYLLILSE